MLHMLLWEATQNGYHQSLVSSNSILEECQTGWGCNWKFQNISESINSPAQSFFRRFQEKEKTSNGTWKTSTVCKRRAGHYWSRPYEPEEWKLVLKEVWSYSFTSELYIASISWIAKTSRDWSEVRTNSRNYGLQATRKSQSKQICTLRRFGTEELSVLVGLFHVAA